MIYFISDGEYIKIGYTENHATLKQRIVSLQIGNARKLNIVALIDDKYANYSLETKLHNRFSYCHINGEWFGQHKNLLRLIKTYKYNDEIEWIGKSLNPNEND
jgi:hypothetical protein